MNRKHRLYNKEKQQWEYLNVEESELSTTMNDKNGNEIFEGDYILLENWEDDPDEKGKYIDEIRLVTWFEGCFNLQSISDTSYCTINMMEPKLSMIVGSQTIPPKFEQYVRSSQNAG